MWYVDEKLSNAVLDHGCKRYAVCEPYICTHAQTKFSIEHTSVGLAQLFLTLYSQEHIKKPDETANMQY